MTCVPLYRCVRAPVPMYRPPGSFTTVHTAPYEKSGACDSGNSLARSLLFDPSARTTRSQPRPSRHKATPAPQPRSSHGRATSAA